MTGPCFFHITGMDPGTYVCLTVADSGMGMDKEMVVKIFGMSWMVFCLKKIGCHCDTHNGSR